MATKEQIYRDLCIEAGTYTGGLNMTPEEWYAECAHNVSREQEAALERAAGCDLPAILEMRQAFGLPAFV